jgi:hypothetical protein
LINQRLEDAGSLANEVDVIINMSDRAAIDYAFGPPGQEGHPERLAQLAKRWNGFYVGFLDWAARVRSISASPELQKLLELAARFADEPSEKYRQFVDKYVAQVNEFPRLIAAGEPLRIEGSIVLVSPEEAIRDYTAELNYLRSRFRLWL